MPKKTNACKTDRIQEEFGDDCLLSMGHKKYRASMAYARALFQFAQRTELLTPISQSFSDFIRVWRDVPVLRQFIRCDAIDRNSRKAGIRRFFESFVHKGLLYLIDKMIDNHHTDLLPGVYHAFCQMVDGVSDRRRIRVISAFPLNDLQRKRLQDALEKSLRLDVILNNDVDPELLGGFVCYTDSVKIDMSLKKDFEKLKSQILSMPCEGDKKI